MNKKVLSHRFFFRVMSILILVAVMGKLIKLSPEANMVLAKKDQCTNALSQAPEDLILKAIEGQEALEVISQTLQDKDVRTLQNVLSSFEPVLAEARVTSAVWANSTQQATIVAVPFTNDGGAEAVLLHVITNGIPESVMVEFPDKMDLTKGRVYTLSDEQVDVVDATMEGARPESSGATTNTCTTNCLLQCLPLWGCTGAYLTVCMAALIACPFITPLCIAMYTCLLYCGGAWSQCYCWCCGC